MEDYDVVVDVLQKHYDKLWEMNHRNMNSENDSSNTSAGISICG